MLDESLLDAPEALARADRRGLLRGAAEAGARVRTAARHAAEAGIAELKPEGRPRAVLVAGPGTAATGVADLIGALAGATAPVTRLAPHRRRPRRRRPALGAARLGRLRGPAAHRDHRRQRTRPRPPRRAGVPPRLHRRRRRPRSAPRSREAVDGTHGLVVPMATAPHELYDAETAGRRAPARCGRCSPRCSRFSTGSACSTAPPEALAKVADRLDRTAERCGPAIATYSNPAKTLAAELADSLPLHLDGGRRRRPRRPPLRRRTGRARRPPRPRRGAPRGAPRPRRAARRAPSRPAPTRTTSSATGSRSRRRCAPASSCCATGPPAASPPRPPPANWRSATTPRSANSNRRRAASWSRSPNSSPSPTSPPSTWRLGLRRTRDLTPHVPVPSDRAHRSHGTRTVPGQSGTEPHGPPLQHRAPLRLGLHHRHPRAARHRPHRRAAGRDVDGRPPGSALPRRPAARRASALSDVIAADPERELGAAAVAKFGPRLPFLLKILAAGAPLSLQVHPDLAQAQEGYADEERAGVPIDAPHRNYKDANHKPELICALTPFDGLCGFRDARRGRRSARRPRASTRSSRTSTSCTPTPRRPRCARCSPPS